MERFTVDQSYTIYDNEVGTSWVIAKDELDLIKIEQYFENEREAYLTFPPNSIDKLIQVLTKFMITERKKDINNFD